MAIKTKKVLPKTHGTNNTITSTIDTTGGGSIQLPTTGNNGTGGLYGQFTPTMGNSDYLKYSGEVTDAGDSPATGETSQDKVKNDPVYGTIFNKIKQWGQSIVDGIKGWFEPDTGDGNGDGNATGAGASTGTGTGAGASTGGETSTPTDTPTMTYEQYIAEQKAREEEKRQAALKEAEIYKERASADAQASYMQNMSTYGVNAENMAQMGLTGGGYSDYLNAQAYAQKRSDMQAADRTKLAMEQQAETTYGDNIAALDKDLFTYQETQKANKQKGYNTLLGYAMDAESGLTEELIREMGKNAGLSEEEIQSIINTWNTTQTNAKGEYSNNTFTSLIADLQNPNTYGNYTEDGIRALGKQWGWTDEQIQQAVDIWSDTKKDAEIPLDGDGGTDTNTAFVMDDFIKDIQNGGMDKKEDGTAWTWEEIYNMLLWERHDGANITDEDIARAKKAYEAWQAYKRGDVKTETYIGALEGDEQAGNKVNNATNKEDFEKSSKEKAAKYIDKYNSQFSADGFVQNVIDTNSDTFNITDFGSYLGSGEANSEQNVYLNKIIEDAKAGKIKEGQIIIANAGAWGSSQGLCVYVGNGVFVSFDSGAIAGRGYDGVDLYIPDGYYLNWANKIYPKK